MSTPSMTPSEARAILAARHALRAQESGLGWGFIGRSSFLNTLLPVVLLGACAYGAYRLAHYAITSGPDQAWR